MGGAMDPQTYHFCRLFRFFKMVVEYFDSVSLNRSVHFATQSQAFWATRVSCQFGRAVVCGNSTTQSCVSLQPPSPGFVFVSSVSVWAEAYCALYGNAINDPAKHEEPPWRKIFPWDRMERIVRHWYRSWWPLELLSWLSWSLPGHLQGVSWTTWVRSLCRGAKFTGARRLRRGWFLAKFLSPQFSSANRTPGQLEVDKRPQSSKEW